MAVLLGLMPSTQDLAKQVALSPSKRTEDSTFAIITGLKTLSSKCPCAPPTVTVTWFPITWDATIVIASHCVGFTFPGIIDDPGSFSGRLSSPSPHRGPDPSKRISFAILLRETAVTLQAPESSTSASCAANDSNLFGAVVNG